MEAHVYAGMPAGSETLVAVRALMASFAFLPFVGEAIAIALGFMRSNLMLTTTSMFAGKLVRYIAMLWALQGAISMMNY